MTLTTFVYLLESLGDSINVDTPLVGLTTQRDLRFELRLWLTLARGRHPHNLGGFASLSAVQKLYTLYVLIDEP